MRRRDTRPDLEDPAKTPFLPILGYVFGAFLLMALLALAAVVIVNLIQ